MRAVKFLQLSNFGRNRSSFDFFYAAAAPLLNRSCLVICRAGAAFAAAAIVAAFKIWQPTKLAAAARFAALLKFDNGDACSRQVQVWHRTGLTHTLGGGEIFINVCERPGNHMLRPPSSYARAIIVPNKKRRILISSSFYLWFILQFNNNSVPVSTNIISNFF